MVAEKELEMVMAELELTARCSRDSEAWVTGARSRASHTAA